MKKEMVSKDLVLINSLEIIPSFNVATIESSDFNKKYSLLVDYLGQLTEIKEKVDGEIKRVMEESYNTTGDTNLISGDRKYTYIPATTRVTVDSKKLQSDLPDVYAKYAKVSQVSATLKSTITKSKGSK